MAWASLAESLPLPDVVVERVGEADARESMRIVVGVTLGTARRQVDRSFWMVTAVTVLAGAFALAVWLVVDNGWIDLAALVVLAFVLFAQATNLVQRRLALWGLSKLGPALPPRSDNELMHTLMDHVGMPTSKLGQLRWGWRLSRSDPQTHAELQRALTTLLDLAGSPDRLRALLVAS